MSSLRISADIRKLYWRQWMEDADYIYAFPASITKERQSKRQRSKFSFFCIPSDEETTEDYTETDLDSTGSQSRLRRTTKKILKKLSSSLSKKRKGGRDPSNVDEAFDGFSFWSEAMNQVLDSDLQLELDLELEQKLFEQSVNSCSTLKSTCRIEVTEAQVHRDDSTDEVDGRCRTELTKTDDNHYNDENLTKLGNTRDRSNKDIGKSAGVDFFLRHSTPKSYIRYPFDSLDNKDIGKPADMDFLPHSSPKNDTRYRFDSLDNKGIGKPADVDFLLRYSTPKNYTGYPFVLLEPSEGSDGEPLSTDVSEECILDDTLDEAALNYFEKIARPVATDNNGRSV